MREKAKHRGKQILRRVSKHSLQICAGHSPAGLHVGLTWFTAGPQPSMWRSCGLFLGCGTGGISCGRKRQCRSSSDPTRMKWLLTSRLFVTIVPCLTCFSSSIQYLVLVGQDPRSVRLGCVEIEICLLHSKQPK